MNTVTELDRKEEQEMQEFYQQGKLQDRYEIYVANTKDDPIKDYDEWLGL